MVRSRNPSLSSFLPLRWSSCQRNRGFHFIPTCFFKHNLYINLECIILSVAGNVNSSARQLVSNMGRDAARSIASITAVSDILETDELLLHSVGCDRTYYQCNWVAVWHRRLLLNRYCPRSILGHVQEFGNRRVRGATIMGIRDKNGYLPGHLCHMHCQRTPGNLCQKIALKADTFLPHLACWAQGTNIICQCFSTWCSLSQY